MRAACLLSFLVLCASTPIGADESHWAFKKPVRSPVPKVKRASWVRNPIDAFILSSLEKKGLTPSVDADRRMLIRRVTIDLTGLPPEPPDVAAFVSDKSPDAYEKVVRRLLASRHYGERWAQNWLDVVRFAESNGYEHDLDRPQAWRYRDWVVRSLNEDKPYDRFLIEQVAGDLIAEAAAMHITTAQADRVSAQLSGIAVQSKAGAGNAPPALFSSLFNLRTATGFLRAGPFHITGGNLDPKEMRQEWLTEAVNGIGNGILGLTVGCAKCHDHKFDPIPQADYYRLQAFFGATTNKDFEPASPVQKKAYEDAVKAIKEQVKPIEAQIASIEKPYRELIRKQKSEKLPPEYKAALAIEERTRTSEQKKLAGEAGTQLNISWDEVVAVLNPVDKAKRAALRQQIFAIEAKAPEDLPAALGVAETISPVPETHLLVRGDPHNPGSEVHPGVPTCLANAKSATMSPASIRLASSVEENKPGAGDGTGRLELARWLASPDNPLTARVIVNRLWHYYFGRGIVATPNDFGHNGQKPTHPELLDWLASELVSPTIDDGRWTMETYMRSSIVHRPSSQLTPWSLKRMHFLIVTSSAYRQSSEFKPAEAKVDPENRLLWRMNRKRLDAEALRDSILAVNGALNPVMGGPSVHVPLEPEVYDTIFTESEPDNLWPVSADPRQHTRRSLYLFRKRNVRLPMMAVFDQPDFMSSCAARGKSVHALQALTLINSEWMLQQSRVLAKRLLSENGDDRQTIGRLYEIALARPPTAKERALAARFLAEQQALLGKPEKPRESLALPAVHGSELARSRAAACQDLCLATLNLNEFAYIK